MADTPQPQGRPLKRARVQHYARIMSEGAPATSPTEPTGEKVGGHLLEIAGRDKDGNLYRCQWCNTTGNYGLFNIIGQRDYCPDNVTSTNGYIWFNADDRSVARMRASHQWHSYAQRCGYALVDYTEVHDRPGICATFTWREQAYVVRYGEDAGRGMRANDIRVELVDPGTEQTGA